ncbi:MAG: tRNA lysidine(34) synthetase TilS [Synergistaceae bacterium]|nr:tRNA lysidine(34) synthetase TilS [Synergistaceae bacterium]
MASSVEKRLVRELESAGKRQGWWHSGGILVALSGGGDSMALLCLLQIAYSGRIEAAHLEHGFRGEASLADARFVEDFCRDSGIKCHVRYADVESCRRKGESPETAGRRMRYEFLRETRECENLPFIATAHNAEDSAETVAHHFFRGTGITGLSGISERRGCIVRPLINCSRDDLRLFLQIRGIPWREDATNYDNLYTRNKIRNELLPWARSNLNGAADRSILGLAGECSRVSLRLTAEADAMLRLVSRYHPFALAAWDSVATRRMSETQLSFALRSQAEKLSLSVIDRKRIARLAALMRTGRRGRFQWAEDIEVCYGGSLIGWIERRLLEPPAGERFFLSDGDSRSFSWGPWTVELEMRRGGGDTRKPRAAGPCAELQSSDPSGVIELCSPDSYMKKNIPGFHVKIPWWGEANTPLLFWKSENSYGIWYPGTDRDEREKGIYVIIAHVFIRDKEMRRKCS